MFVNENGKKFLNLPEQVLQNQTDIETNKTNITSLQSSKQDTATAVNDDNLKEKVEALASVDLTDVSVASLTNTGNTTNTGTLDQEGAATFGSDVEVDGTITLNSPESVTFKTGSLDFSELTSFIDTYNEEAYQFRFAGIPLLLPYETSSGFNPASTMPNLVNATNIHSMFHNMTFDRDESTITLPSFKNKINAAYYCFTYNKSAIGYGVYTIVLNSATFAMNVMFYSSTNLHEVKLADGASVYSTTFNHAFSGCTQLTEIGAIDASRVYNTTEAFSGCTALKSIHITHFKVSFDISASTQFEESDLVEIIGNLDTVSTAQTLTMGSTNLAKLTQDEILVATGKGWTLA